MSAPTNRSPLASVARLRATLAGAIAWAHGAVRADAGRVELRHRLIGPVRLTGATHGTTAPKVSPTLTIRDRVRGSTTRPVFPAARVAPTAVTVTTRIRPGWRLAATAHGATGPARLRPASRLTGTGVAEARAAAAPTVDVALRTVRLHRHVGGESVSEEPLGGRTDWEDHANAAGRRDGHAATLTGNTLAPRAGRLVVRFPAPVAKDALAVETMTLRFFHQLEGAAGDGDHVLGWRLAGEPVATLARHAEAVDRLAGGSSFALPVRWGAPPATGVITSWADVAAVEAVCRAACAAGQRHTHRLDAAELVIAASFGKLRTDTGREAA